MRFALALAAWRLSQNTKLVKSPAAVVAANANSMEIKVVAKQRAPKVMEIERDVMKTKLKKGRVNELEMREQKMRNIVLSSRSGAIIPDLELTEQHAEEIANVLGFMCLEDSVVTDLLDVSRPSEGEIANRIAVNLKRQADQLKEFSEILGGYSRMKLQVAQQLVVDCSAG